MKIIMLFILLFCHIVDDYYLQGWLAQAKQKKWWENNAPDELYKNDYKMALAEHAFSWSFMVHIPIIAYLAWNGYTDKLYVIGFCVSFIINCVIHAIVDNIKANKMRINLIQDQMIHFAQIICIWCAWMIL